MVKMMISRGIAVVTLDNLATGHRDAILGAGPEGFLGARHEPEMHLVPLVLRVASGRDSVVKAFGRDYDTPDGTCIHDYVHVVDLCQAHLAAIEYLLAGGITDVFNLGNGSGYSVQGLIESARRITGCAIVAEDTPRRTGDAARLVADASKAHRELGWKPQISGLERILEDAWRWECRLAKR